MKAVLNKSILLVFVAICLTWGFYPPSVSAQTTTTAIEVSPSLSTPSTLSIRQNNLILLRSILRRELRLIQRCLRQARLNLRDTRGNIDRVAQTDILNCTQRLDQINRRLASFARKSRNLSQAAQYLAITARRARERAELARRLSGN